MSSIEPSGYTYRIELVSNDRNNELLNNLHEFLHTFIKPVHKDTVDILVLKITTKLKLYDGTVEVINSSQNQKERIRCIIEAVKGEKLVNGTALKDFLEILVNFEEYSSLSEKIRELISTRNSHIAIVVPNNPSTTSAQPLAPSQQTEGAVVSNYPSEQLNSPSSKVFLDKSELVKRSTQKTLVREGVRPLTDEELEKLENHLVQNKPKLMELTILDDLIIAELEKAEMLGPGDVAALVNSIKYSFYPIDESCEKNNEETNRLIKNRTFYDILKTRLDKYFIVAKIMGSNNQSRVAELLNMVQL